MKQQAKAGDGAVIVQAGRDAILQVTKAPPAIKLVKLTIDEDRGHGALRQKINIIIKNNGDTTAFLTRGFLLTSAHETICLCNQMGMRFSLSTADWTYDVDIGARSPHFDGRHSIAPNEVVNFDVLVGRKSGGHEPTIYRSILRLEFDEGDALETDYFHLMISGPIVWQGGFQARGPSPDEWGRCQVDNIRRLQKIGFDYRSLIDPSSRQHIEAVSPGIFGEEWN